MSATAIGEKRPTTLPADVSEAAGLQPGDQVDWRFEEGEIRGKKLAHPTEPTVVAKLVKRNGRLTFELPNGLKVDEDSIARAVAEERRSR